MKTKILPLVLIFSFFAVISQAQSLVWHQSIQYSGNLRGAPVALSQQIVDFPSAGKVVVHFDGMFTADDGDRIVLAASNEPYWGTNNDNIGMLVPDAAANRRSFSHTRSYDVVAGADTFYAVGQNYVEEAGSGIANIYASLSVEFFPATGTAAVVNQDIYYNGNLRGAAVNLGSLTINPTAAGKIVVHFDGYVHSDVGDKIVVAASNAASWGANAGNVSVESSNANSRYLPFSHTRVYDVTAGAYTYYAVGENYVNTAGSGNAYIYGNLSAEFFPATGPTASYTSLSKTGVALTNAVALDSVTLTAPTDGKVLVTFDGNCNSDLGDRIVLAASDVRDWGTNADNVNVEAPSASIDGNSFSHTRSYDVTAGTHTYYAVAQNYVETGGSGSASIYGSLTAKFYANASTGVKEITTTQFNLFPNPTSGKINISLAEPTGSLEIKLADMNGRIIKNEKMNNTNSYQLNVADLAAGMYFVTVNGTVKRIVKE